MRTVFNIIGPVMVGPSSSHTAGAVRIGLAARAIVGGQPSRALITLYGSFARTYRGHGTDLALIAGLLGMNPDDERIPDARRLAAESGLDVRFEIAEEMPDVHPNTAKLELERPRGTVMTVVGSSIGGGSILITQIDDFEVDFSGENHAIVVSYKDRPGIIAKITSLLATENINIATMRVSREAKHARALAIIEVDQPVSDEARGLISRISNVDRVMSLPPVSLA